MQSTLRFISSAALSMILILITAGHAQAQTTSKSTSKPAAKPTGTKTQPATSQTPEKPAPPTILIKYINSYATALELAKAQNKTILMQYTSANCGWCTVKDKEIDADPYLADFINKNFIPVIGAKDAGAVREKFKPSGTPHTLILTSDGEKLIERIRGYALPDSMFDSLDEAVALNQLATRNPAAFDHYAAAVLASDAKNQDQAMSAINSAIELDDKAWPLFSKRASLYYMVDQYEPAIKDLTKAKTLAPRSPGPMKQLGIIQIIARRYMLGAKELENARKLTPRGDYQIVMLQAGALSRIGKRADALKLLQAAGEREYDSAYYADGFSIRSLAKVSNEDVSRAIQSSRYGEYQRGMVRWTMAGLLATAGDKQSAATYLQEAVSHKHPYYYTSKLAMNDLKLMGIQVKTPEPAKPAVKKTAPGAKTGDTENDQKPQAPDTGSAS